MKKLIAISVVFALAAGVAFAVDVSGNVIGTVNFLEGNSGKQANDDANPIGASASMNRIRIEGSGENDDGTFGGWVRFQPDWGFQGPDQGKASQAWGYAWWKPIDVLKLGIGGNPDGFYGKEGVTGWMFYQMVSDTGVVNAGNVWGGGYGPVIFRNAFYGGFGDAALHLTISPAEIVDINIAVPFWANNGDNLPEGKAAYIFKRTNAQLDFKLDFGNIALTYVGNENKLGFDMDEKDPYKMADASPGTIFAYFGLTSIENLGLDVGLGFPLPVTNDDDEDITITRNSPIAFGVGVKYVAGDFGVKARVVASFAGSVKIDADGAPDPLNDPFLLTADVLPFYNVSESLRIFFSAGLGMTGATEKNEDWGIAEAGDSVVAWHINPYVEVGNEWGPTFYAGLRIWSDGVKGTDAAGKEIAAIVNWAVPIAIGISF